VKLGCASWTFATGRYEPPYDDAVELIGRLGFEGIEFILRDVRDVESYWTPAQVDRIRGRCDHHGLTVTQLALYQDVVADLASLDPDLKVRALERFAEGARLAQALGSPLINFVSQWPVGLTAPTPYVPRYWYINQPGQVGFSPKLTMSLPKPFDWDTIWANYVDSVRQCCELAAEHGLKLAFEGHAHVIVPHSDSFLRLADHVQHPALRYNFDVAWQFIQREYIPWSLHKLGDHLVNVHARDGDGLHCYALPPGEGIVDWYEVFRALRHIGYNGFVSLEMSGYSDMEHWVRNALDYLTRIAERIDEA
jgi:sugar phosphate isomerase/epimerase